MLCALIKVASLRRFLWVHTTYHYQYHKKYLKKKISDVVTLGTFCYRDQSFINWRGRLFFHGRWGTEPEPPPPPPSPHTQSRRRKNSDPRLTKHFKISTPTLLPARHLRKQLWQMKIQNSFLVLLNISVQFWQTKHKLYINIFLLFSNVLQMITKFAGVQKCLTHWMKTKIRKILPLMIHC